ncbi:hypothetical protein GPALN_011322 [Globodera pallida]|nr:hypothetical protein GPALN_011322 [Globodera pallida]
MRKQSTRRMTRISPENVLSRIVLANSATVPVKRMIGDGDSPRTRSNGFGDRPRTKPKKHQDGDNPRIQSNGSSGTGTGTIPASNPTDHRGRGRGQSPLPIQRLILKGSSSSRRDESAPEFTALSGLSRR